MNVPSKTPVCLVPVIIYLECFIVSVMMAMNWVKLEETVQVYLFFSEIPQDLLLLQLATS